MASQGRKRRPGRPKNPIARETLLALAMKAFAERGYAGASMAEIVNCRCREMTRIKWA